MTDSVHTEILNLYSRLTFILILIDTFKTSNVKKLQNGNFKSLNIERHAVLTIK